jgi:soluble lytic murein transglycosylase-like protein
MSPAARLFLAALPVLALLGASAPAIRAEITREVRGKEIVATNLPTNRRVPIGGATTASRASLPGATIPVDAPELAAMISGSASRYGFDPSLIRAVVAAESGFDHRAVSRKGARGLMQLMPETARKYGVRNLHDPATNLDAGVAYLRELVARHQGDVTLALAAYNAGPEAVARHGGVPPYEETRRYLERVRRYYGDALQQADWSVHRSGIRLKEVERGGVPHFTNVRRRRVVTSGGSGAHRKPAPTVKEPVED